MDNTLQRKHLTRKVVSVTFLMHFSAFLTAIEILMGWPFRLLFDSRENDCITLQKVAKVQVSFTCILGPKT